MKRKAKVSDAPLSSCDHPFHGLSRTISRGWSVLTPTLGELGGEVVKVLPVGVGNVVKTVVVDQAKVARHHGGLAELARDERVWDGLVGIQSFPLRSSVGALDKGEVIVEEGVEERWMTDANSGQ